MATLVSPGTSISIIDQSMTVGAGPGTVPLIFIATQQNKTDPTNGSAIAVGTTKANAGTVYTITSQRDLISTFGNPVFANISGTPINGYPLNEYGLLSAYSFLGISNRCNVVRADIDLAQLEATPIAPTAPAAVNTYWLDESSSGSTYGLFVQTGTSPSASAIWTAVKPKFNYNFLTGSSNTPVLSDGVNGDYATVFQSATGTLSYWTKISGAWVQLGTTVSTQVLIQSVWPDLSTTAVTQMYWIKTTSAAQGANIVLRKMSATTSSFVQVEAPILANDTSADTYYSTTATGSAGQFYIEPVISGSGATAANSLEFRYTTSAAGSWAPFESIIGSTSIPVSGPANGQLWFNSLVGLNSDGTSTVDILVNDGQDHWLNCNLPGFSLPGVVGNPTLYPQSQDPRDNIPTPTLAVGDIWVQTDVTPYPVISRWTGSAWVLVNNEDQTTPSGIIFADARPNPLYHVSSYAGQNNGGSSHPDLDADAPQAALYPKGFILWNTRYSTNNVKEWQSPFVFDTITAQADDTNSGSTGRWVTTSGNNPGGVPYMGSAAQQIVIVKAVKALITSSDVIRAEDLYFNLIAAPGFVEVIEDMLLLNDDRADTAFVVGDTPFTLSATGTELQKWATNANSAYDNSVDGLVSASKYFAVWYPSGLATNTDGTDVVVPPSHMALRTIAYNDQVSYPWFAPAGLQRGVIDNASTVGYVNEQTGQFVPAKLSNGQRDLLYTNGINPIRTLPTGGIVMYGQKTRQSYASATDRINVVRLENYIRYQLDALAQPFLFEPNDSTTQKAVTSAFSRALQELITLRALYDFLVVCDSSNNTPDRVDANQLWIDIAIQPVKAIEFIYIPIRIVNTGSSLTTT